MDKLLYLQYAASLVLLFGALFGLSRLKQLLLRISRQL